MSGCDPDPVGPRANFFFALYFNRLSGFFALQALLARKLLKVS